MSPSRPALGEAAVNFMLVLWIRISIFMPDPDLHHYAGSRSEIFLRTFFQKCLNKIKMAELNYYGKSNQ